HPIRWRSGFPMRRIAGRAVAANAPDVERDSFRVMAGLALSSSWPGESAKRALCQMTRPSTSLARQGRQGKRTWMPGTSPAGMTETGAASASSPAVIWPVDDAVILADLAD